MSATFDGWTHKDWWKALGLENFHLNFVSSGIKAQKETKCHLLRKNEQI